MSPPVPAEDLGVLMSNSATFLVSGRALGFGLIARTRSRARWWGDGEAIDPELGSSPESSVPDPCSSVGESIAVPSATTNEATVEPGEILPDGVATEPEARGVLALEVALEGGSDSLGLLVRTARDSLEGFRDEAAEAGSRRYVM